MIALNWKRILLILGFLIAVIVFGYLLYLVFFRPALPPGPPENVNVAPPGVLPPVGVNVNIPIVNLPGVLPPEAIVPPVVLPPTPISPVAKGGLTQTTALTTAPSFGVSLSSDGTNLLYYDRKIGRFYKVTPEGKTTPLTDKIFYEVEKITWATDKTKAILEYPDGSNILYDFATNDQVTLPQHWKDFDFSPQSNRIIFKSMGVGSENRWLAVANADGSQARRIEHLGDEDARVLPSWSPNNQMIAMFLKDYGFERQQLFFVGLNEENFKFATLEGRGFQGKWSPKGDLILYSVYNPDTDYKPNLWITSASGENIDEVRKNLKIQSWANKCAFSDNETIYCAVPQNLREGAGIFPNEMDESPSNIYKIDLKTGFKSLVAQPEGEHNIKEIIISQNGQYLYFTDKDDKRLYQIRLK